MIELNCNDFYRAIKMLSGVADEYRFHFDEFGVHAVSVDTHNVIMQGVTFNKHSLLTYYLEDNEPKEVGIDVSQLLPFAKSHKSDGFMKLSFEMNPDGKHIHNGKIETDKGAVLVFKTLDVSLIRRDPLIPKYPFEEKYSQFTVSVKDLKQAFKDTMSKRDERVIFKFTGEGKLCIENSVNNLQAVIPSAENSQYCMFSYNLINTIVKTAETKDNLRFILSSDRPAVVINTSASFENVFLCAPRIEAD